MVRMVIPPLLFVAIASVSASATEPPTPPQNIDAMVEAAMEDPPKFIDVLTNCAAYHGLRAVKAGNDSTVGKEHDDMAIMLLSAAYLVPPKDEDAINKLYEDKLFGFAADLNDDTTGQVEKDMDDLGMACEQVEEYGGAVVLQQQAKDEAAAALPAA